MSRAPAFIRNWNTPENRAKAAEAPGKPLRLVAGSWIADLVALRKCITLCSCCERKFDAGADRYARHDPAPGHRTANGACDGCGNGRVWPVPCAVFLPKG